MLFNVYTTVRSSRSNISIGRSLVSLAAAAPQPTAAPCSKSPPSVRPVFPAHYSRTAARRTLLTLRMPHPGAGAGAAVNPVHGILSKPFAESARNFLPHQETICIPGSASIKICLQAMDKAHLRSCMICLCQETGDCGIISSPRMGVPCCMQVKLPQCGKNRPPDDIIIDRFKMLDMRDILKFLLNKGQDAFDRITIINAAASRRSSIDDTSSDICSNLSPIDVGDGNGEGGSGVSGGVSGGSGTGTGTGGSGGGGTVTNKECTDIVQSVLLEPAGNIADVSGKNRYRPCWVDDPLESLIKAFDTSPRVPLFSWDSEQHILKLVRIFSATDLFALFHNSDFIPKMDQLSNQTFTNLLNQPVSSFSAASGKNLQVSLDSDPLLDTMRRLVAAGFTALPIVDRTSPRKTLGVISVRDFRQMLLRTENIRAVLSLSTLSYVAQVRQIECLKAKFPSISVNQNSPLRAVVQKMLAADIQRIFLVDEKGHLTGIFSRTDLGRLVARTVNSILNQVTDK